jgi:hypothetical protein
MNALWSAESCPFWASASTVRTDLPSIQTASVLQE